MIKLLFLVKLFFLASNQNFALFSHFSRMTIEEKGRFITFPIRKKLRLRFSTLQQIVKGNLFLLT